MLKLNKQITYTDGVKLLEVLGVDASIIVSSESNYMMLDEEEITPDLLGVNDYSEANLNEGDEVFVLTYELNDGNIASLIYDNDYAYSAVLQDSGFEPIRIERL